MVKRLFDVVLASLALVVASPIILIAAAGVKLSSRGPAFYLAQRVGRDGITFTLFKLRTMHIHQEPGASSVTASDDPRVFPWGQFLRKTKIDELPQLWNIVRGDMSIVGPRPEDVGIVREYYGQLEQQTLAVRPGLAGVGSLYYYMFGEQMLAGPNTESVYVRELLPIKLALDVVYIRRSGLIYDLRLIGRTVAAIAQIAMGRRQFPEPPEMAAARALLAEQRRSAA